MLLLALLLSFSAHAETATICDSPTTCTEAHFANDKDEHTRKRELQVLFEADKREQEAHERTLTRLAKTELTRTSSRYALDSNVGLTIGVPLYLTSWVELPISPGKKTSNDGLGRQTTRWIRSVITLDGMLQKPGSKESQTLVSRLAVTIWQLEYQEEERLAVLRLGTVEASVRTQPSAMPTTRLDVELLGFDCQQILGLASWQVRPYFEASVRTGIRLFDASLGVLRFLIGTEERVGLLIGTSFFVAARAKAELDQVNNSYVTIGGELGWRLSKVLTLKAGVDHSTAFGEVPYDPLYVIPRGWSFNIGALFRY